MEQNITVNQKYMKSTLQTTIEKSILYPKVKIKVTIWVFWPFFPLLGQHLKKNLRIIPSKFPHDLSLPLGIENQPNFWCRSFSGHDLSLSYSLIWDIWRMSFHPRSFCWFMQFRLNFSQPTVYLNCPKWNILKLCLALTDLKTVVKQSYVKNHFKKHIYFDIRVGFCGLLGIWFLCGQSLWGFMHNHYTVVTLMTCPCWLRNRGSGRELLGLFEGGHWAWCRSLLSQMTIVHLLKSLDKPISLTIHSNNGDQVIFEPFRTQIGLI